MKKIIGCVLVIVMALGFTLTAMAEHLNCNIKTDDITAAAGSEIMIPVRITDNSGFTNFAIALEYDHEVLELRSINTQDEKGTYLCGSMTSVNTEWQDENGKNYGYIVCTQNEKVTDDGVLFTATFYVKDNFAGKTIVTPVVQYMRNQTTVFSVFENLKTTVSAGAVEYDDTVSLLGDVNGDGDVTPADAARVYKAAIGEIELTEKELSAADVNNDGAVTTEDADLIFEMTIGK